MGRLHAHKPSRGASSPSASLFLRNHGLVKNYEMKGEFGSLRRRRKGRLLSKHDS